MLASELRVTLWKICDLRASQNSELQMLARNLRVRILEFFCVYRSDVDAKKSILSATLRYFIGEKLSKMMVFEIF